MPLNLRRRAWPIAVVGDALAVLVFATIGRASHHETTSARGIWHTAWPFLLGAALGLAMTAVSRVRPTAIRAGVRVWVWTVVIGMVVRSATGAGTAWAFVVVAVIVLGVFLIGWRAVLGRRSLWGIGRRSGWRLGGHSRWPRIPR
ncbi:MAG TPA: DUF3054 domain-containing protein [Nocardioides sp.]|uniref:DUF3054 domain-containing protein n=1 Tax=Nocardioides sp. TaxID=35761 RepID=UPI002F401988